MTNLHVRTRRTVALVLTLLCGLAAQAAAPADGGRNSARRPNIVLIIADDVGLDMSTTMYPGLIEQLAKQYGPAGLKHPGYQMIQGRPPVTPNLDRFARQGVVFTNAWAEPFCSPTRASILTGLFAAKTNVLNYTDPLTQHYTSFVQRLRDEAGYSTGLFGKWHLAGMPGGGAGFPGMKPKEAGFEVFRGNMHAALKTYWDWDYMVQDETTPANQWRTEKPPVKSLPGIAATNYAAVVQTADAVEWIAQQEKARPDKPWFTWLAFNLTHATAQQRPSQMAVPNADTLGAASTAEMKACNGAFGSHEPGMCSGEAMNRAMANSMDTLIGKLLETIDRLDPETYVIYIGDNGTPMYGRPNLDFIENMYITRKARGKGTTYESGARVPLAIRGPGIAGGRINGEFVAAVDLFPTILSLAGLKPPTQVSSGDGSGKLQVDGVSLTPILQGKANAVRDPNQGYLMTESLNLMTNSTRQVAARNATYKVMCTEKVEPGSCEFYNLARDPLEEFPLDKPAACDTSGTPAEPRWHYCRLAGLLRTESFFAKGR
jgi:arylsulfatase A-like enzyme